MDDQICHLALESCECNLNLTSGHKIFRLRLKFLVEYRAVMGEVVSSTPAGPALTVLK